MADTEELITGLLMLGWLMGVHVGMAGLFRKVGIPVWHAFVPILNGCQLCRTAGISRWWLFAMFIPLANLAFVLTLGIRLANRFGYSDIFGVALGFSGLGLLPIMGFGSQGLTAELSSGRSQFAPITPSGVPHLSGDSRRSVFVSLLVLSMIQFVCLLCVPGLMVVGAMGLGGVSSITPAMEVSIAVAAFIPLSLLGAFISQWVWYAVKRDRLALGMSAMPLLNVIAFFTSLALWLGR